MPSIRADTEEWWVRGKCACGWSTPSLWAAVAGAERAVRAHIAEQEQREKAA
jgi:hypothetical protein